VTEKGKVLSIKREEDFEAEETTTSDLRGRRGQEMEVRQRGETESKGSFNQQFRGLLSDGKKNRILLGGDGGKTSNVKQ